MIRSSRPGRGGGATWILVIAILLYILPIPTSSQQAPSLIDYVPKSGPISGGTWVNITGSGFITTGQARSKCSFQLAGRGNRISAENLIHNESSLSCILPTIDYLTDDQLQDGDRMTRLAITGSPGVLSNSVEFFLYDLDLIRISNISPNEGLSNSTNITLFIQGENFLDTKEATCSIAGPYNVPAHFINSSFLQCLLSPYPNTSQVVIDVSMNGQPVANIAPLRNNSTTFTYFASPPQIVSCRFTPSYAQLILSFDREVEIGPEQRPDIFIESSLSCSEIFTVDTRENVVGLGSNCFWHNTLQRQILVELALDNRVQLGSTVDIAYNTIRTRYVQYSRHARGSVTVSLPDVTAGSSRFLPMAVIEAPSVIPSCGNFSISGTKSQNGGSRGLQYKWTIGTTYDENGTLIQDSDLSVHIPTGFTSLSVLELSSDIFNPDLLGSGSGSAPLIMVNIFDVQLEVRNFLGLTSTARISNISIAETAQPSVVIVGGNEKTIRTSVETVLEARIIFPDGCLMLDQVGSATYTWSIVDQFNGELNLNNPSHSSVLVLPTNSLQLDTEYVATLSVEFPIFSVTVNASVRLVTDVELVDLRPRISGGVRRSVGVNEPIELDARSSQYVNTSTVLLGIRWMCVMKESEEICVLRNGQSLSFSRDNLVQVIASDGLAPGEYNFTLTLSLLSTSRDVIVRDASTSQTVVILPYSIPKVAFIPGADNAAINLESVLVHKELILNIAVQSDLPGVAQWSSEYVIGYAQVNLTDNRTVRSPVRYNITEFDDSQRPNFSETMPSLYTTGSHRAPSSFANHVTLVITANTLLPQNAYRFKFTATDMLGNSGFAEVNIYTESKPTSGTLLISPQNGFPLMTVFSLSAPGWTDDFGDIPLFYQFGLRYIFLGSTESFNPQQPACCHIPYDVSQIQDQFDNISCICEFMTTGISEQNELLTTLPLPYEETTDGVSIQVQQLVQVFDKNGAMAEESRLFSGISSEELSNRDDPTQLLQPLSDSTREQLDALGLINEIRQTSLRNWRQALAQLTTLASFAEVSTFISSPYLNLTLSEMVNFKVKTTELVLDIYESYIPISKSYLDLVVTILHSTTSYPGSAGITSNNALISRIMDFLQVFIDSANNFDEERGSSSSGFSAKDSHFVLRIFHNLIHMSRELNSNTVVSIQDNSVTQAFLSLTPRLGQILCTYEHYSFVNVAGISFLKSSRTNLPVNYQSTEKCSKRLENNIHRAKVCLQEDVPTVAVNFSSVLFERYLSWLCQDSEERTASYCSGVCLTSALHTQNLLWQGSMYEYRLKSPLFQLYLLNPHNGAVLEFQQESQQRISRNTAPVSDQIDLMFPIISSFSNASNLQCVYWNGTSRMWIGKPSYSGLTLERNRTVTNKICHFRTSLGVIFTILERCPDGQYGQTCLEVCPEGLWGAECRQSCDCNNGADCSPFDGSCDCTPGWQGDKCETKCAVGTWGKDCSERCLCENGAECDHVTGFCSCTPGWIGTFCNTTCPDGFYGNNCGQECGCNEVEECDKMTGFCHCSIGFTGQTCHQICPTGFYGDGCTSECQCFTAGTRTCHHVNGSCECFDNWTGNQCNLEITPPPEPAFQIWWIVVGVVVAVLLAVAVVCTIIIIVVRVRIKKQKKILPINNAENGDQVSHHKDVDDEVAVTESGSDLKITPAISLEVIVPSGAKLKDIFIKPGRNELDEEDETEFKEPQEFGGKLRWQIIRLMPTKSSSPSHDIEVGDTAAHSPQPERETPVAEASDEIRKNNEEQEEKKEGDPDSSLEVSKITQNDSRSKYNDAKSRTESEDDHMTEIVYKRGVYLAPNATLKDLRNGFIEYENLESNDRHFQLLKSDVPGDFVDIDTEDEVLLSQIEHTMVQPRTVYIENIDAGAVTMELCVCGKFADLECGECGRRGYCSLECQQEDWFKHALICQKKTEKKKKRRKSSKKKKKKHKKYKKHKRSKSRESREYTPSVDVCICGKEAEFECSRCERQGYCSEECQQSDWELHQIYCEESTTTELSERDDTVSEADSSSRLVTVINEPVSLNNRTSLETLIEETEESEEGDQ